MERALAIIAPHQCLVCKKEGQLLCNWCKHDVLHPVPSRCYLCQARTDSFAVCQSCRRKTVLKNVWVASEYVGVPKDLIHSLKYQQKREAAGHIAQYLDELLPIFDDVMIAHVPTTSRRVRQRSFDQAQLIARQLAKGRKISYEPVLLRSGQTRQVGAKRSQRLVQLENAFAVRKPDLVRGRTILLIDDVTTTGASINSAATTLKKAGAKQVNAAVFAQAL